VKGRCGIRASISRRRVAVLANGIAEPYNRRTSFPMSLRRMIVVRGRTSPI
jgi:hypothetical protein